MAGGTAAGSVPDQAQHRGVWRERCAQNVGAHAPSASTSADAAPPDAWRCISGNHRATAAGPEPPTGNR